MTLLPSRDDDECRDLFAIVLHRTSGKDIAQLTIGLSISCVPSTPIAIVQCMSEKPQPRRRTREQPAASSSSHDARHAHQALENRCQEVRRWIEEDDDS